MAMEEETLVTLLERAFRRNFDLPPNTGAVTVTYPFSLMPADG